ncbi:MAG TPA: DNA translocase FtsK [Candidatus Dormibacteraeota bacterium]|nr:DNA translocase FtsK [Candidatus Dormibacteraeota bacterium]
MRIFELTENRRINELIGFVGITLAVLLALSLLSYSPQDASFNVAAAAPAAGPSHNWIGPVGAHVADLFFQGIGYAAFLFPVGLFLVAFRRFRSQKVNAPVAKVIGCVAFVFSLPAELSLLGVPEVRGALPPGGMFGELMAHALRSAFNSIGAHVVALACIFAALLLTTQFTFAGTAKWMRGPLGAEGFLGKRILALVDRVKDWREMRESEKLRKRVEEIKIAGRPAVPAQQKTKVAATIRDVDEIDDQEKPEMRRAAPVITFSEPLEAAQAPRKSSSIEPKIAKGKTTYRLPSPTLLRGAERSERMTESELKEYARAIEQKCAEFDVVGHVTQINPGPVVTTFELKPEAGIKYSRITGLADDLCLALKAESILIERIPGKSTVGIEVPNPHRETIALREVIESPEFSHSSTKMALPLGKDLVGHIRAADLAQMPHLLIAGATGTGKSVFINSMLMGMLYKSTPDELKVVLIDPKRIELGLYEDIPHLYTPVVTDPKVASNVLRNATKEMERRLKLLAQRGVRNIDQYNRTFEKGQPMSLFDDVEETEHKPLPYIVIVIDELADLMMVDTTNVEESITRLAQMARAVGIHLILATQRPSVDVITGLIKANFPARISFRVASKVDSRTILDTNGAESLLGRGDMLYLPAGSSRIHRIHGPLVTEQEVAAVCEFWRDQAKAIYNEELLKPPKDESASSLEGGSDGGEEVDDALYQDAIRVVCEMGRASTSTLQRRLRVGYGRAARLIDLMEKDGIVGPPDGSRPREVLKKKDWMREFDESVK